MERGEALLARSVRDCVRVVVNGEGLREVGAKVDSVQRERTEAGGLRCRGGARRRRRQLGPGPRPRSRPCSRGGSAACLAAIKNEINQMPYAFPLVNQALYKRARR